MNKTSDKSKAESETTCVKSTNPVENFEALWNVFNERYAFFDVRGVDWQKQKEVYRPQVTDDTTPEQLFKIMTQMTSRLNDGHVEFEAKDLEKDFDGLKGYIIDLRECPGGDDEVLLEILGKFADRKRVAFHRKEKLGFDKYSELNTWYVEPNGASQFTGPVVLLTNDAVFSGGDVFAMVASILPNVTIVGDRTNGIFSYQFCGKLPNGWTCNLSNQIYYSADMICYESKGVPVDIEVTNTKDDVAPLFGRGVCYP